MLFLIKNFKKNTWIKKIQKKVKSIYFWIWSFDESIGPKKIADIVKKEKYEVIALNSFLYSDFAEYITPNYMVFSDPIDFKGVTPETEHRKYREIGGKEDKKSNRQKYSFNNSHTILGTYQR